MTEQEADKIIRIEHTYQIVRTALVVVAIILLFLVILRQGNILDANRNTLIFLQKNDQRSDAYTKCIADSFASNLPDLSGISDDLRACLIKSNLSP